MAQKCHHQWRYAAGVCRCTECKNYLQPNGDVTSTPTGRGGRLIEHLEDGEEPEVVTETSQDEFIELTNFLPLWRSALDHQRQLYAEAYQPSRSDGSDPHEKGKAELLSLARQLIEGKLKPDQSTYDRLAKAINDDGKFLTAAAGPGFNSVSLKVPPNKKSTNRKIDIAFELPPDPFSGDFIERYLGGREDFTKLFRRRPEIEIYLSPALIDRCHTPQEILFTLEAALKFYGRDMAALSRQVLHETLKLGPVAKGLIVNSPLAGIVTMPLLALLNQGNVTPGHQAFNLSKEFRKGMSEFIRSMAKLPELDRNSQKKIIAEVKRTIFTMTMLPLRGDLQRTVGKFPEALQDLCDGKFGGRIETIRNRWIITQTESAEYLSEAAKQAKVKRLKKIPSDLVSYILIEGEAIRDANDKMLIVSYAYGKLDIVEWYIELIDTQSKRYIVPHTRDYLVSVKRDLLAAIKKVMDTPIPKPSDPTIQVQYPAGYEG